MGTRHPASAASAVVYCGDSALFLRCRLPEQLSVEHVPRSQLVRRIADPAAPLSTLILSAVEELPAARIAFSSEASEAFDVPLFETLAAIRQAPVPPRVILLTQSGLSLDACCDAVRLGVSHFIDIDAGQWKERLAALLEDSAPTHPVSAPLRDPRELLDTVGIRAVSKAMQSLILQVYRGAQVSDATVLIHGESGTGKQLLAEAIHRLDPKRGKMSFVPVNCAAITGTLAESELFGHTRGAFSGATDARLGYFRTANRGTIFLDEISELPMHLQPKLLRVLQEQRVLPVGADREEPIDVRVIAATNVSLQEKIARGEFRLDLYQRLNVIYLAIPPLRQRTEDIPLLVEHFIHKYRHYGIRPITEVDPRVYELLKRKAGTGNVRELENIIRQALVFKIAGDRLELQDLPRFLFDTPDTPVSREIIPSEIAHNIVELIRTRRLTLKQVVDIFEKSVIQHAAADSPEISKVELAKVLGLPRRTLYHKLDSED